MKIVTRREEKIFELKELAKQVDNDKFENYKEKQKVFRARSKVGKWFHVGGTYKKQEEKETNKNETVQM